ncbi:DUF6106 family protein [Clostridium bowmanii]|uniref:DUF6106 family protein n=1 Tax=Clostridium bowmanii TaxID=132925 RepID=UPI001C0C4863|nr:DUF6106 family protein [Clostridium bowmanii]MBU3190043.1 hypothetical protein [Clostridium bowmanii]MCA1074520.1 DUF6106 family protein [Clostridium bowmanii]
MDHFYEQLVTTYKTGSYKVVNAITYLFAGIGIATLSNNLIFAIILLGVAGACFFYKGKLFVEYEYQFTNGEIDIEKIFEMKKRKKFISFNIKEVTLLAPEGSAAVKDYSNKPSLIVKGYPNTSKEIVYVAMVTEGNNKMQLSFVPNQKFLDYCYRSNPSAVKK